MFPTFQKFSAANRARFSAVVNSTFSVGRDAFSPPMSDSPMRRRSRSLTKPRRMLAPGPGSSGWSRPSVSRTDANARSPGVFAAMVTHPPNAANNDTM